MIFDRNDSFSRYSVFTPEATSLIQGFLNRMDANLPDGRIDLLDGDRIYVSVSSYQTKGDPLASMPESHRQYCDVQLLLAGTEDIYVGDVARLVENAPYQPDYTLYRNDGSFTSRFRMEPGVFAVFLPEEGHMPCIAADGVPAAVKKVVIKVAKECLNF